MDRDETVKVMAKILCPKGTANCEKCSKNYKCNVNFSQLSQLFDGGCRIIGDDEIVVTKRQHEQLKKHNNDRKRLRNKWQTSEHEAEYWKIRCKEIGDVASRETAIEILQELKNNIILVDFGCGDGVYEVVDMDTKELKELANKYGVVLEESDE